MIFKIRGGAVNKQYDVILVCPKFHGYQYKYKNAFESIGLAVALISYEEQKILKLPFFFRVFDFVFSAFLSFFGFYISGCKFYRYFLNKLQLKRKNKEKLKECILSEAEGKFGDLLVVIKGFGLDCHVIESIVNKCKIKNKILYQWDPLVRYPLLSNYYYLYDHVYTFQSSDVIYYPASKYLPTPFEYISYDCLPYSKGVDFVFIGSYSKYRYTCLLKVYDVLSRMGFSCYFKLITKNKFKLIFKSKDIVSDSFISMSDKDKIYSMSKCIVEISNPNQNGITQRVLEALSSNKSILSFGEVDKSIDYEILTRIKTFNEIIKMTPNEIESYISTKLETSKSILDKYTYKSWARTIYNQNKD